MTQAQDSFTLAGVRNNSLTFWQLSTAFISKWYNLSMCELPSHAGLFKGDTSYNHAGLMHRLNSLHQISNNTVSTPMYFIYKYYWMNWWYICHTNRQTLLGWFYAFGSCFGGACCSLYLVAEYTTLPTTLGGREGGRGGRPR